MILSIPYNRFEINNVQLQQFMNDKFNRSIALLTYNDSIEFKDITILSPPMKVIQYNVKCSTFVRICEGCKYENYVKKRKNKN